MAGALIVRGGRELATAFDHAGKDLKKGFRDARRTIAEPVQRAAQTLVLSAIPRIGPDWYQMRIGITRKSVYIAPKQRGVKGRGTGGRRRPNLADKLAPLMEEALEQNAAGVAADYQRLLDTAADTFNRKAF